MPIAHTRPWDVRPSATRARVSRQNGETMRLKLPSAEKLYKRKKMWMRKGGVKKPSDRKERERQTGWNEQAA